MHHLFAFFALLALVSYGMAATPNSVPQLHLTPSKNDDTLPSVTERARTLFGWARGCALHMDGREVFSCDTNERCRYRCTCRRRRRDTFVVSCKPRLFGTRHRTKRRARGGEITIAYGRPVCGC